MPALLLQPFTKTSVIEIRPNSKHQNYNLENVHITTAYSILSKNLLIVETSKLIVAKHVTSSTYCIKRVGFRKVNNSYKGFWGLF
jgi:hypothetical protein